MRNLLKTLEAANRDYISLRKDELGMEPAIFIDVAKQCGFEPIIIGHGMNAEIKLKKRGIPIVMLYDEDKSRDFCFLDLADFHAGHPDFDESMLTYVLDSFKHKTEGIKNRYVFIAGDLVDGVSDKEYTYELMQTSPAKKQEVLDIYNLQQDKVYSILSRYDFDYRVINGNHEYTFVQLGIPSPLTTVEKRMQKANKKFTLYNTYIVDFVIAGVVKRLMHLESYNSREGANLAYDRLENFNKHGGLNSYYFEKKYPIRFFQCGHIHRREVLFEPAKKVYISVPGSFIKPEMLYKPYIIMQGSVVGQNKNILLT